MLPRVIVLEKLVILLAHHGAARSTGCDDVVIGLKNLDETLGKLLCFGMKAIVEKRLPAASLRARKMELAIKSLQNPGHRNSNVRIKLVGQAGDE